MEPCAHVACRLSDTPCRGFRLATRVPHRTSTSSGPGRWAIARCGLGDHPCRFGRGCPGCSAPAGHHARRRRPHPARASRGYRVAGIDEDDLLPGEPSDSAPTTAAR